MFYLIKSFIANQIHAQRNARTLNDVACVLCDHNAGNFLQGPGSEANALEAMMQRINDNLRYMASSTAGQIRKLIDANEAANSRVESISQGAALACAAVDEAVSILNKIVAAADAVSVPNGTTKKIQRIAKDGADLLKNPDVFAKSRSDRAMDSMAAQLMGNLRAGRPAVAVTVETAAVEPIASEAVAVEKDA